MDSNISSIIDLVFNLDQHLNYVAQEYEYWILVLLFIIIFAETGLVITPFLPGDSLLFIVGALAGAGTLDLITVAILLILAAILGDALNYHLGKIFGTSFFSEKAKILKLSHIRHTEDFYKLHGGKTIVIARFIPIVRTFAPFVAGMGSMNYKKFMAYNMGGASLWVCSLTILGYLFGNLSWVQENLSLIVLGLIVISLIPLLAFTSPR